MTLLVGNDVTLETVDSAAVFLFNLFLRDQAWSRNHAEEIRRSLGPFPASAATTACDVVKQIVSLLPEDWRYDTGGDSTEQSCSTAKEFGHNIAFKYAELPPCTSRQEAASQHSSGYDSLSDDAQESQKSELISGLLHSGTNLSASETADVAVPLCGRSKYTGEWLKEQCRSCSKGNVVEWRDLYSAVFELLSSCEENYSIENSVRAYIINSCTTLQFVLCFSWLSFLALLNWASFKSCLLIARK